MTIILLQGAKGRCCETFYSSHVLCERHVQNNNGTKTTRSTARRVIWIPRAFKTHSLRHTIVDETGNHGNSFWSRRRTKSGSKPNHWVCKHSFQIHVLKFKSLHRVTYLRCGSRSIPSYVCFMYKWDIHQHSRRSIEATWLSFDHIFSCKCRWDDLFKVRVPFDSFYFVTKPWPQFTNRNVRIVFDTVFLYE